MEASPKIQKYFSDINENVEKAYLIAKEAKSKGFDPDTNVIPLAKNMAERVEGLISTVAPQIKGSGMVPRIQELEEQYGVQDWRVALVIAKEVAQEKFCKFKTKLKAMETGIRVGLSYVTVGVVSSPLEGFVQLKIRKRKDGKGEYFAPFYSGPIRSAGGTGASASLVIVDYVRKEMGYQPYDATDMEIKRSCREITDFHERITNLQYLPSEEEVAFLTKHLPIQIDGDASEKIEVSNFKDLDRIETNKMRNGFALVMAEAIAQKAPKVWKQLSKWGKEMGMEHWNFLEEFVDLQKKIKSKGKVKDVKDVKITPDYTYIKDLVAGRPVLGHPLRQGTLRLRYGRARVSGLSSCAMHPCTQLVLNDYMAIGTHVKSERPMKGAVFALCDSMEGPIVKLKNGNVLQFKNFEESKQYVKDIEEVIYLGDILINYELFLNRAHKLVPVGFCEEWWVQYLDREKTSNKELFDKINKKPIQTQINLEQAKQLSKENNIPLHPKFIYFWDAIKPEEFLQLFEHLKKSSIEQNKIVIPWNKEVKRTLELIGIPHKTVLGEYILIEEETQTFLTNIGELKKQPSLKETTLEMINDISEFEIKDKLGTFIGTRMGRPEKAKMRKLNGSPQALFPIGEEGGRMKCFQSALEIGKVNADFPIYHCETCNKGTIYPICEQCNSKTKKQYYCKKCQEIIETTECEKHPEEEENKWPNVQSFKRQEIDINYYYQNALKKIGDPIGPPLVKGIVSTTNSDRIPENLIKGILRAKHQIYVNKEGTVRYDMTEMAITHFKPNEIGTSIEKLKELGYDKDIEGKEIMDENQVIEIRPQDIILPACEQAMEEGADKVFLRVGKFMDEMLEKLYGLKPFYNFKTREDIIGHLFVSLSPHTSAGVIIRAIGFSKTQGFLAHPLLHCLMRRDCDSDEAGIMFLLDALINFSRGYLPNTRGITQDTPLVLTSTLLPSEVDDQVLDMDVCWRYPLAMYEAGLEYKQPWDIEVETYGKRLGKESQYEGLGFTHPTSDLNAGIRCSAYKSLPSMQEKVAGQMDIAVKLRAVDTNDVAKLVIERHFIRDIKGNLRKFSMQQFRCVGCNEKFRRPPLKGKCTNCGGKIIFTIAEGSVIKYLEPAMSLANKYNLPAYLQQSLELTKNRIESVFGKDADRQEGLGRWFG